MGDYKYETHLHTSEASACGSVSGVMQARYYKNLGYTGIFVTDHFFNGNCAINKGLSWKERVNLFCLGYENAKKEGDKIGLDVFFGWEAYYDGQEFLIYGLNKDWLLEHENVDLWSVKQQYECIKRDGGMVIQAHPYRMRWYIKEVRLYPDYVDGVEGINNSNEEEHNFKAIAYAKEHGFFMTEGTDCHGPMNYIGGMLFDHRLTSPKDFMDTLKSKQGYRLLTAEKYGL